MDIPTSTELPTIILSSTAEVPVVVPQAVISEPAAAESPVSDQWSHLYQTGRKLLEKYQEEGNPAHLSDAIDNLQNALDLRPHGDSDRSHSLDELGNALQMRYDGEGNLADVAQAIAYHQEDLALRPPEHPGRAVALENLAEALLRRYRSRGESADLVQVIQLNRQVLDLRPPGHPDRSISLSNLANAILTRYKQEGESADLVQVIQLNQQALDLRPPGHPDRSMSLNNLAIAILTRYKQEGESADLVQVIQLNQQALDLHPPGHPDRSKSLNNLANAILTRYKQEGESADLVQAIQLYQQTLDLRPPGHPDRSRSLNNLAIAILTRYEQEGESADLVQAIQLHQQALDLRPPGHPDRSASLSNLAIAILRRYEREGESADLMQVIQLHQQALDLHPPGHPDRSRSLNNLAIAILTRYEQEGESADLVQVIQLNQHALDLRPPGHPDRSRSLNNLAIAILTRYKQEGESADLVQVIQLNQQALDLHPPGHPDRSKSLNNLANAILTRYKQEGESADLVQAIQLYQQALDLRPPGHPDRSMSLQSLASAFLLKYRSLSRSGVPRLNAPSSLGSDAAESLEYAEATSDDPRSPNSLVATIIAFLREASQRNNCSPRDCLRAALRWITVSKDLDPDSTLDAYISALQQLDIVLAFGQSLDKRHSRFLSDDLVRKTQGLGGEAATWALQRGELNKAVELLEQGRSLLLAQVGRYRIELDDLRRVDSKLADHFHELSCQLDASVVSGKQPEGADLTASDQYGRYRNISTDWDRTVDEVRMLPGFDTFLKPIPYDRLRKAAAEGPVVIIIPNESGSDALIILEDSQPHHVHLPLATSDRLATLSNAFPDSLDHAQGEGNRTEGLCLANLRILWNEVVGPIAQALQDLGIAVGSRIWWCPTSVTSFLPLHAAGTYVPGRPMENFPNLYVSSYTPTLHSLVRARRHASITAVKKLLVIAQPDTPGEQRLRRATEEADVIKDIASGSREVTTLSSKAGTLKDVQHAIESHPWIHFICHGNQVRNRPLDSYLSLYDGHLTIRNIVAQNLPSADFAFLSACHSAAGDKVLANEALHLAGAMQFAGFRGVVGTLWRMWDDDGRPLSEAFYQEMAEDWDSRRAAGALSEAIKVLRRNRVPMSHWIRFIHIGI